jgi:hypothetical protein
MRFLRHLLFGLLVVVVVIVGLLAFVLYDPLSSSRRFLEPSQLIRATASDRPVHAEPTVDQTDPAWLAALAKRYQPSVVVSGYDRFWPMSLASIMSARWDGHGACVYVGGRCKVPNATPAALSGSGSPDDWVQLPTPVNNVSDVFRAVGTQLGVSTGILHAWPHTIDREDPFNTAQIYFEYLRRTRALDYRGLPAGLISLQYWFFYPVNYFPLVRIPLVALRYPIASTIGNTDYHQGDLEHVAVLLDPKTMKPRYLWMARHANEGEAFAWHSTQVQWSADHATIYAALGSHASYAHCGIQRRSRTYRFINDYVVCVPNETFGFEPARTPLVDLSHTVWGCWRGHLGQAGHHLLSGLIGFAPYETSGPYSPLQQQENFGVACHVSPGTPKPAPKL